MYKNVYFQTLTPGIYGPVSRVGMCTSAPHTYPEILAVLNVFYEAIGPHRAVAGTTVYMSSLWRRIGSIMSLTGHFSYAPSTNADSLPPPPLHVSQTGLTHNRSSASDTLITAVPLQTAISWRRYFNLRDVSCMV